MDRAADGISRSFVSRLLRLTLLALDIQEAILEGRQAKGMQLEALTQAMPGAWGQQQRFGRELREKRGALSECSHH